MSKIEEEKLESAVREISEDADAKPKGGGESDIKSRLTTRKTTSFTPTQWAEAVALWESGEVTVENLAKRFKKSVSYLNRKLSELGAVKGSAAKAHGEKVAKLVAEAVLEDSVVLANRIRDTKEEHYRYDTLIVRLVGKTIGDLQRGGQPIAAGMSDFKALDCAANVLKKIREDRFAILGLDKIDSIDTTEIPELVIKELTADQVDHLRNRNFEDIDRLSNEESDVIIEDEDDKSVVSEGE